MIVITGKRHGERASERCIYVENRNDMVSEMICEPVEAAGSGDSFVEVDSDWFGQSRILTFVVGLFWSL